MNTNLSTAKGFNESSTEKLIDPYKRCTSWRFRLSPILLGINFFMSLLDQTITTSGSFDPNVGVCGLAPKPFAANSQPFLAIVYNEKEGGFCNGLILSNRIVIAKYDCLRQISGRGPFGSNRQELRVTTDAHVYSDNFTSTEGSICRTLEIDTEDFGTPQLALVRLQEPLNLAKNSRQLCLTSNSNSLSESKCQFIRAVEKQGGKYGIELDLEPVDFSQLLSCEGFFCTENNNEVCALVKGLTNYDDDGVAICPKSIGMGSRDIIWYAYGIIDGAGCSTFSSDSGPGHRFTKITEYYDAIEDAITNRGPCS